MSGSATETSKFFGWNFRWDRGDANILWFWLKNTGIVIPAIVAGIYLLFSPQRGKDAEGGDTAIRRHRDAAKKNRSDRQIAASQRRDVALIYFYLPFVLLFLVSNIAKFAPWEWDNIKILIYWYVGSIPLIALALVWMWERKLAGRIAAAICFVVLVSAGALDVWRTASGQNKIRVFDSDAMAVAYQIKQKTAPDALFLNAPTYNSAIVLSGRRSFMRYTGHLSSHGIDFAPREADVKQIYKGGSVADALLKKYNIEYVLISPEERNSLAANEEFFRKYPVAAESGQYRVYKVMN
jgi:hypothetical protein